MENKFTCIMCPLGCELTVTKQNNEIKVFGNACVRGQRYGISEVTNPSRMITTLIKAKNGLFAVKTSALVPKDKILEAVQEIHNIKIENAFVGDVVKTKRYFGY